MLSVRLPSFERPAISDALPFGGTLLVVALIAHKAGPGGVVVIVAINWVIKGFAKK